MNEHPVHRVQRRQLLAGLLAGSLLVAAFSLVVLRAKIEDDKPAE